MLNAYLTTLLAVTILDPSDFKVWVPGIVLGIVLTVVKRYKHGLTIRLNILLWWLLLPLIGLVIVINNTYLFGDASPLSYWVLGPIVWFMFALSIAWTNQPHLLVHRSLTIAAWIVAIGNFLFICVLLAGAASNISFYGVQAHFGIDERGFFAYSTSELPQIAYFFPYFTYRWIRLKQSVSITERILMLLLTIDAIASLRVFIILVVLVCIVIYVFSIISLGIRRIAVIFTLMLLTCLVALTSAVSLGTNEVLSGIYDLKLQSKVSGNDPRYKQIAIWVDHFLNAPIFGNGTSSTYLQVSNQATGDIVVDYPGPIRNPYGYEVLVFRLLSEIGLLLAPLLVIYSKLSLFAKAASQYSWQVGALRLALLSMILQSQTNSYLYTSGWLVVFYLPMCFAFQPKQSLQLRA